MNFTPDLEQIPHWLTLKKICKAQAVLDLLICGQEFETYHRYAPAIQEEYEGQEARIGFDFEEEDGPSLHLFFTKGVSSSPVSVRIFRQFQLILKNEFLRNFRLSIEKIITNRIFLL